MDIDAIEILKWVGIVFVGGFIGYFGRHLSMIIIDRLQRKKSRAATAAGPTSKTAARPDVTVEGIRLKAEKKKAKAEAKKAKKS